MVHFSTFNTETDFREADQRSFSIQTAERSLDHDPTFVHRLRIRKEFNKLKAQRMMILNAHLLLPDS